MIQIYFIELVPFLVGLLLSLLILTRMRIRGSGATLFDSMDIGQPKSNDTVIELGGLSMFPILLVSLCLPLGMGQWFSTYHIGLQGLDFQGGRILQILAGGALLYIVGLKNDVHGTADHVKFLALLLTACLFPASNLWIQSLQGLFGVYRLPPWLGMSLTVLLAMSVTELFVLLDDMDGLGVGLMSLFLLLLGSLCLAYGFHMGVMVCAAGLGISLPYNALKWFRPAWRKTLVGHAGSYVMGYVMAYVTISVIQQSTLSMPMGTLMIVVGVLLFPVLDVLRMLRLRVQENRPLLVPDRNQLQHQLMRMGLSAGWVPVTIALILTAFFLLNVSWVLIDYQPTLLLAVDLLIWLLLELAIRSLIRRMEQRHDQQVWQVAYEQSAFMADQPLAPVQHFSWWERGIKRGFDVLGAVVLLVLFSPLFLLCWLLIKLDDHGPALFRQERIGLYGRPFCILKFRSMRLDAEREGPALCHQGNNDPRLTRVGGFLRTHHLDELPQLWNVLRGDMSFTGYRPERKFYIDQIMERDPRYQQLYQIRPGVTSYATLYNGYTDTMDKMLRRLEYDIYYLEHRSIWFDLRILWTTFISILFGKKF